MEYKDYYQILGISKQASQDEIKKAYRKQARKYHPDVSKENQAEDRFKEAGEAYEVLKDPEKRTAYDQLGSNWKTGEQGFQPPPNWDEGFEFHGANASGENSNFSDFFESLFGGAGFQAHKGPSRAKQGNDSHAKILIDLEDAYHGAQKSMTLRSTVMTRQGQPELKTHALKVTIPKGVSAGQKIRLQGQGSPGLGDGLAGDLYLEVGFNPHRIYQVEGRDVSLVVPIAPWEAALGNQVAMPTPTGKIDLKIPKGVSSGKRMRLKGRGLPGKNSGDFYVILEIVVPETLSDKEQELYQSLKQASEQDGAFKPRENLVA
jgi:curved DNA-binding protein